MDGPRRETRTTNPTWLHPSARKRKCHRRRNHTGSSSSRNVRSSVSFLCLTSHYPSCLGTRQLLFQFSAVRTPPSSVFSSFICKPIVSSETTQWRNPLVFLTQSYEPDSNKPQRKSVLSSSAVFTPAAGRVVEQSHAHSAEVWEMWFSLTSTCNHTTWGSVRTSGATEAREARGRKAFHHFLSRVCDRTENKLSQDRF